ncbi:hypothetical protein MG293_004322 [Ovis ammon polii]|uniref:Uncharacterized protein n=1 Tax=Ovis ammon polii TaxID=230172 RepID=A0AAD4UDH0_OVIAM|nr:hypothetical protein MG293_004322 [Ovis ammon polii]
MNSGEGENEEKKRELREQGQKKTVEEEGRIEVSDRNQDVKPGAGEMQILLQLKLAYAALDKMSKAYLQSVLNSDSISGPWNQRMWMTSFFPSAVWLVFNVALPKVKSDEPASSAVFARISIGGSFE